GGVGGANGGVIVQGVAGGPAFEVTLNFNDHCVGVETTQEYLSSHVHAKGGIVCVLRSRIAKVRVRQNDVAVGAKNSEAVEIPPESRFIAIGKIGYCRRIRGEFILQLTPISIHGVIHSSSVQGGITAARIVGQQ